MMSTEEKNRFIHDGISACESQVVVPIPEVKVYWFLLRSFFLSVPCTFI